MSTVRNTDSNNSDNTGTHTMNRTYNTDTKTNRTNTTTNNTNTPPNTVNNTSLQWFNQHPVISTVLWMFGTEIKSNLSNDLNDTTDKNKSSTLCWKDDYGGNINEYILQVQRTDSSSKSSSENSDVMLALKSHAVGEYPNYTNYYNNYYNTQGNNHGNNSCNNSCSNSCSNSCNNKNVSSSNTDGCNSMDQSPQWGFYVPITPPQPDMYSPNHNMVQSR